PRADAVHTTEVTTQKPVKAVEEPIVSPAERADDEEVVPRVPRDVREARLLAEQAFLAGRDSLRANSLTDALSNFHRAMQLFPALEYAVYAAWVEYKLSPGDHRADDQRATLKRLALDLVAADPQSGFGNQVLGNLALLEEDADAAKTFFQRAR